jgi:ATP-binding cassette subfamily C protein CydCD
LDEPAEHLEPDAADELVDLVLRRSAARATVLITQRLTGLDQVDEIVVLDRGAVVERGTHAELLGASGRYASWWWEERSTDPMGLRGVTATSRSGGLGPRARQHTNQGGTTHHG